MNHLVRSSHFVLKPVSTDSPALVIERERTSMGLEEEKRAVRECLISFGICICRNHGAYYLSQAGQRVCHLASADVTEQEIRATIRRHIYDKCYREKRLASESLALLETPDLGRIFKNIMSDQSSAVCRPVGDGKKGTLMYLCGCDGVQPKRRDMFKKHIKSEIYRGVCPCSTSGKSVEERAVIEAVALALCRVRCVRASCGLWLVTSRELPKLSTLPRIIEKAVESALKNRRDIKSKAIIISRGRGTGAVAGSDLAPVDEHDNDDQEDDTLYSPEDEAESAGEAAVADTEGETNTADFASNPPKPTILLFGYHHRKEENDADPTYDDLLREAMSCKSELPGAVRDKARIVRVRELGFDTFSVSIGNKGENDERHYYYGDFCARNIVSKLKAELKRCGKLPPVQICVDWFYCPSGWDTEKYLRPRFFTCTLIEIVELLSTEPIQISLRRGQRSPKRQRTETKIPSGVIFIPFTRRIVAEIFKARDALERHYEISFIGREQLLVEHPMYAATASIPDEEMAFFQKSSCPEDRNAKEFSEAIGCNRMDGAANNVDTASLKEYMLENCPESTRMIKLAIKR